MSETPAQSHRIFPTAKINSPISAPWIAALCVYYIGAVLLTHFHKLAGSAAIALGLLLFAKPLGRLLQVSLIESWQILNQEAKDETAKLGQKFDYMPLVVLASAAVILTLIEYFGDRDTFEIAIRRWIPTFLKHRYYSLTSYAYWSGSRVTGYLVVPFLISQFLPGERFSRYGLSFRGFFKHLWIYGLLFMIVLLPVIMVSYTKSFQDTYPFYKLAARSWFDFLAWEAFYAIQFFSLEVFFRGFMIHPLKRSLGAYAIFAMALPYCMIHYNKPLAEVFGAILAGIVLGTLSLRTGSIWCGVLIHISVAVTMDSLALVHTAGYPGNPRLVLH